MKHVFLSILFLSTLFLVEAQNTSKTSDITKVLKFTNDNYNMGRIPSNKPTEFTVDIENVSMAPVIIENVTVGCGCTTPKYIKGEVIAPGAHSSVIIGFNGNAVGDFSKEATIFFNQGLSKRILFHGVGIYNAPKN